MGENVGGIDGEIRIDVSKLDSDLNKASASMDRAAEKMGASAEKAAKRQEEASKRAADKAAKDAEITAKAVEKASERIAKSAEAAANRQAAAAERAARAAERQAESMAKRAAAEEARAAVAAERAADRKAQAAQRAADRQVREAQRAAEAEAKIHDTALREAQRARAQREWDRQRDPNRPRPDQPGGGGSRAQGMLTVGRFIDDLQYVPQQGLRPIANQLVEIAPKIGIVAIGLSVMASAAKAAWAAMKDGGDPATEVDRLRAKVEELDGAWIKTADSIREAGKAREALSNAEKAAEARAIRPEGVEKAAGGFKAAAATVGGNAAESVVRQLASEEYASNDIGLVKRGLESGAIGGDLAASVGLSRESTSQEVARQLDIPEFRAELREALVGSRTNELMAGLANGDPGAAKNIFAMAGNSKLGARDARGEYTNGFLRSLASETAPKDAMKAAMGIRGDYGKSKSDSTKEAREEAERRASDLAGDLQTRFNRGGGTMSEADVAAALSSAGANPADASATRATLAKSYGESVRERALSDNLTPDGARAAIASDYAKEDAERARRESDKARSEALGAAEQAAPALQGQANAGFMRMLNSGASAGDVTRRIEEEIRSALQGRGLGADQAAIAASAMAGEAQSGAEKSIAGGIDSEYDRRMNQKPKGPELFGAEDLWRKVAVAAGGGENDRQLNVMNSQLSELRELKNMIREQGLMGGGNVYLR
jgi:hypothetical protein